jgi:tripartite-type tricarboxylate transporter receptor subunit TctC
MKKLITAFFVFVSAVCFAEPLTVITATVPGSLADMAIRYLAPDIEKELQRSVVVMNMPGADGLIAMQKFSSLPADGNTLLAGGSSISFATVADRDYKPQDSFKPLMGLVESDFLLVVSGNSKVTDVKSLIAAGKQKGLMGGSSSIASTLSLAILQEQLGVEVTTVEYKQYPQMVIDVADGDRTDFAIVSAGNMTMRGFVSSGKLRPIAVLGPQRSNYYKDVKTLVEQGYKSVEAFGWSGLHIHNRVPDGIRNKLLAGITAAMKSEHGSSFEKQPGEPRLVFATEAEITALQKREAAVYKAKASQIVR